MRPKYLLIAVLLFVAYLLGARAGRERYESIKHAALKRWNDPAVKKARKKARKARDKGVKSATKRAKALVR